MSLVRNASFIIVKSSGVREEVSDVNKSMCKNIFFVRSRLCTSPLVRAPPQLTLFTLPATPSTPRHVGGINFESLRFFSLPTSAQKSVKHKSTFMFTFTLRTIYAVKEHYSQISCGCVIYPVDGVQSKCKRKCTLSCELVGRLKNLKRSRSKLYTAHTPGR